MTDGSDPIAFCLEQLPQRFAALMARAQVRADAGDARLRTRLAEARAGSGVMRLVFSGEGGAELFVALQAGLLQVTRERPAQPVLRHALCVPLVAAGAGIGFALRAWRAEVEDDGAPVRLPFLASSRADKLFGLYKFAFDLSLEDVPEVGSLVVRVGLGRDLPEKAELTISASYGELREARARGAAMQELITSGKIGIQGDMAKAMMLAMTLAQLR